MSNEMSQLFHQVEHYAAALHSVGRLIDLADSNRFESLDDVCDTLDGVWRIVAIISDELIRISNQGLAASVQ